MRVDATEITSSVSVEDATDKASSSYSVTSNASEAASTTDHVSEMRSPVGSSSMCPALGDQDLSARSRARARALPSLCSETDTNTLPPSYQAITSRFQFNSLPASRGVSDEQSRWMSGARVAAVMHASDVRRADARARC